MSNQTFILDRLSKIIGETDLSTASALLKLVDEAGRTFIGGAGQLLLLRSDIAVIWNRRNCVVRPAHQIRTLASYYHS